MAIKHIKVDGLDYNISYQIIKPDAVKDTKRAVLFLHGWGASKELMSRSFMPYFDKYTQIYIDMPGFGASTPMQKPLDTYGYAKVIAEFLEKIGIEINTIIAHSFGGKVSALLSYKISSIKNIVLLSSAGIKEPKKLSIKLKIAIFKFAKKLGLGFLRRHFASSDVKGMNEVMYETFKRVVDEDFKDIFAGINDKRVLIFWGEKDSAVSTNAAKILNSLIKDSKLEILSGDHFFFIKHAKHISNKYISGDNA